MGARLAHAKVDLDVPVPAEDGEGEDSEAHGHDQRVQGRDEPHVPSPDLPVDRLQVNRSERPGTFCKTARAQFRMKRCSHQEP